MTEIHVNFDSLQSGYQGIQANYRRLQQTLDNLNSDLTPMVASWSGAAQESYVTCKNEWNQGAEALSAVLNNIGVAVNQAHENYTNAENSARNNWA